MTDTTLMGSGNDLKKWLGNVSSPTIEKTQKLRTSDLIPTLFAPAGVFSKRILSSSSVYTLVSGVAFGYATVSAVQTLSRQPPSADMTNFNRILLNFAYATLVAPSAVVPVIMWFETTKIQKYLHEWRLFQVSRGCHRVAYILYYWGYCCFCCCGSPCTLSKSTKRCNGVMVE